MKKTFITISAAFMLSVAGKAQTPTVLANFDFNEGSTSLPQNSYTTAANITASINGTEADANYDGTATGSGAFVANTTAGKTMAMSGNTNTNTWTLTLGGSNLYQYISYKVYFQAQRSSTGATTITLSYSTDGSTYTNASTTASPGNGSFTEATIDLSAVTALNNQTAIYIKFTPSGASNSSGTLRIDNLEIQATESASGTSGLNTYFNGDVGILTNSPAYPLDVNGAARVSGNFISGATTVSSLSNSGNLSVTGTSNLTGAVTTGALTSGATTVSSLSNSGNLSVTGTSNLTGAVTTGALTSGATTVSSLNVSSLAGTGNRMALVNSSGNIYPSPFAVGDPWVLGGNAAASPNTLGTNDGTDLIIVAGGNGTTGTNRMWFNNSTGFAQIGGTYSSTSPNYMFNVVNNNTSGSHSGLSVNTSNMGNSDVNTLLTVDNDNSAALIVSGPQNPYTGGDLWNNFVVYGDGSAQISSGSPSHTNLFSIANQVNLGQSLPLPSLNVTQDCATSITTDFDGTGSHILFNVQNMYQNNTNGVKYNSSLVFGEKGNLVVQNSLTSGSVFSITNTNTLLNLDFAGNLSINPGSQILIKGTDTNHGLGYFDATTGFATKPIDGPVLYGWSSGALGTVQGSTQNIALQWDNSKNVTVPILSGSGTNMVVASSTGVLSTQPIPTSTDDQQLSVSSGNLNLTNSTSVPLSSLGDNMGNCVAGNDINMNGHGITFGTGTPFDVIGVADIVFGNILTVGGPTTLGPIPGNFGLETPGDFEIGDDLTVTDDATIDDNLTVNGTTTQLNTDLNVSGLSSLSNVNAGATSIHSTLNVTSTSSFDDDVTIGSSSNHATLTIHGDDQPTGYALVVDGAAICSGDVSSWSDKRFKRDVTKLGSVTDKLKKLNGYTYYFKTEEFKEMGFSKKQKIGFIAQELKEVFPQLVNERNGYLAVNYSGMVPVLVEAINEQQKTIDSLQGKTNKQDSINNALQNQLTQLANAINACCANNATGKVGATMQNVELSDKDVVVLNQNVPNPFAEQTVISYNIPQNTGVAQLAFYDALGRQIKTVDITTKGAGQLNVYANDLTNGIYSYTLVVDGRIIDTKKMVKQQ